MTATMYYTIYKDLNGVEHSTVKSVSFSPRVLDNSFRLTSAQLRMGISGSGYLYDPSTGAYLPKSYFAQTLPDYIVNNPISGSTYSKASGFTLYKLAGSGVGGANLWLSFQRNTGGTVYTLTIPPFSLR